MNIPMNVGLSHLKMIVFCYLYFLLLWSGERGWFWVVLKLIFYIFFQIIRGV